MDDRPLPADLDRVLDRVGLLLERVAIGVVTGLTTRSLTVSAGVRRVADPFLRRIRDGAPLRETLVAMFTAVLTDQVPERETSPRTDRTEPVPEQSEPTTTGGWDHDHVSTEMEGLSTALEAALRRARHRGATVPAESVDVLAWTLTSLLVTLLMRSRDGEDTGHLVAAAERAMAELLT